MSINHKDQVEIQLKQKESDELVHENDQNHTKKRERKKVIKKSKQQKKLEIELSSQQNSEDDFQKEDPFYIDAESLRIIQRLTNNYQFTYIQIKHREELRSFPLRDIPKDDIQYVIRKERQNKSRNFGISFDNKGKKYCSRTAFKRTNPKYLDESDVELQQETDSLKEELEEKPLDQFSQLAQLLIKDFDNQPLQLQIKMIESITQLVKTDERLLFSSLEKQVSQNQEQCFLLMKERKYCEIKTIFSNISPMAVILINLKLSIQIQGLVEEGTTLVQTFLPYLKECSHYNFIKNELFSTVVRFIHTIVQYFLDTDLVVDIGLATFALKFAPQIIQPIIKTEQDKRILIQAFTKFGFYKENCKLLAKNPNNFLWKEMIEFLLKQNQETQSEYINIFSKIIILQNPVDYLTKLEDILVKRRIFVESLIQCQKIQLNIQQMIQVLNDMKSLQTDTIKKYLCQDSSHWVKLSQSQQEKTIVNNEELKMEELQQFSDTYLKDMQKNERNSLESFIQYSNEIEQLCEVQHNLFNVQFHREQLLKNTNILLQKAYSSGKTWVITFSCITLYKE